MFIHRSQDAQNGLIVGLVTGFIIGLCVGYILFPHSAHAQTSTLEQQLDTVASRGSGAVVQLHDTAVVLIGQVAKLTDDLKKTSDELAEARACFGVPNQQCNMVDGKIVRTPVTITK